MTPIDFNQIERKLLRASNPAELKVLAQQAAQEIVDTIIEASITAYAEGVRNAQS